MRTIVRCRYGSADSGAERPVTTGQWRTDCGVYVGFHWPSQTVFALARLMGGQLRHGPADLRPAVGRCHCGARQPLALVVLLCALPRFVHRCNGGIERALSARSSLRANQALRRHCALRGAHAVKTHCSSGFRYSISKYAVGVVFRCPLVCGHRSEASIHVSERSHR